MAVRRILVLVTLVLLIASACASGSTGETVGDAAGGTPSPVSSTTSSPAERTGPAVPAPEFPEGLDWLNVDRPLTLNDLRGKVVLVDFWTYGCINCIHVIPDLKRLESEFPDELVVVGVHSAKFANEGTTGNIRQIVQRYDLHHPVVNDADFAIWRSFGVRAWPTIVVIDPDGNIVLTRAGEGVYDAVRPVIADLVDTFSASGRLDTTPLPIRLERDRTPSTLLSYPGKVFADPHSNRLVISDTGHHRIILADRDGRVLGVFGSGSPGFDDGPAAGATFSSPQGVVISGDTIYVADTGNHAVRTIDVATGAVSTLVGTGAKGWPPTGGPLDEVSLNSPWALALDDDLLYVANAGTHQIWTVNLSERTAVPTVGSTSEGTRNGPLLDAALAQPSGLALGSDGTLFFADAESSSIRSAAVNRPQGTTALVAGSSRNLFDFGDRDGVGEDARFQHPLGVARYGDLLLVADTYNSKIKEVDPSTGRTVTRFGGEQGWRDGTDPLFFEPGGVSVAGDTLWVADTNNHAIRRVSLQDGTASTLVLTGLDVVENPPGAASDDAVITLPAISVGAGDADVVLDVTLPDGYKVNGEASSSLVLSSGGELASFPGGPRVDLTGATLPVTVPIVLHEGTGTLTADLSLVWCRKDAEGLCLFEQARFEVPVTVASDGPSALIRLPLQLTDPGP